MGTVQWNCAKVEDITSLDLYKIIALRVDVFVVEQNCPYPDLDHVDTKENVYLIWGEDKEGVVACTRIIGAGISYPEVSIGRVAIAKRARGIGLGHTLMDYSIAQCDKIWGKPAITISAQAHLENFYQQHGFKTCSKPYLEDDIPHIKMTSTR